MKDKSKVLKTYGYMFDKLQFIAQNLYTFSKPLFYLSCFIFCCKVIEYQLFRKMKHTTFMFHF